jgi:hypothetical protein
VSERKELVPLAEIRRDGGTQSRAALDQDVVAEYAERYTDGRALPPIVVFYDGEAYWLADGFHRCESAERAGKDSLPAEVRQGTKRDAILFSVGANASHGLRRSNADKRRAVEMLLSDDEWRANSDRWIADKCGVSHTFVQKRRPQLATVASSDARHGQDGKVRRLPVVSTTFSATEVADGAEIMGRAGFTNAEVIAGLPDSAAGDSSEPRLRLVDGESSMKQPHPNAVKARAFEVRVQTLVGEGLGTVEIAKKLDCSTSAVQGAKRRLGIQRQRPNPLSRLVACAVEFSDTWQDLLPDVPQLVAGSTSVERNELVAKLDALLFSTKRLIKAVRKQHVEGSADEHEQVREAATESD